MDSSYLHALCARASSLSDAHKATDQLITRLSKLTFQPGVDLDSSDARTKLCDEIHEGLKLQEEELELLRQEVEDAVAGGGHRGRNAEWDKEASRLNVQVARLGEDLRLARSNFRKAQLQAKRNLTLARRKERELLFAQAEPSADSDPSTAAVPFRRRGPTDGKSAPGGPDHTLNAAGDVTAALRRTHQILETELARSRFAQETLDQSTAQLKQLTEQYSGLDGLLESSRELIGTLVTSKKSDSWYLETAVYLLVVTVCWLVFRRFLYGPLWWLVWLPSKYSLRLLWILASVVGLGGKGQQGTVEPYLVNENSWSVSMSGAGNEASAAAKLNSERVPKMELEGKDKTSGAKDPIIRGDGTVLKDSDAPRNPKKRVLDTEVEAQKLQQAKDKDEL